MKKVIPALLLACVLFACKKETNSDSNESPSSTAKVPVSFSIQNFLVSQQDISANGRIEGTDPSLAKFVRLDYFAFASDGVTTASHITQNAGNSKFGILADSLAPGTYTIVLCASAKQYFEPMGGQGLNSAFFQAPTYNMASSYDVGDLFYKKMQVTVSANGNPPTLDVNLNRLVGLLKVDLKDALPASDPNGAVTVNIYGMGITYSIVNDTPSNVWPTIGAPIYITRTSQTTFESYMFGISTPLQVVVNWKDKTTGAAQTKTISNVTLTSNKKTTIVGYLYGIPDNLGGSDIIMRANQDWSTDSVNIKFN